MDSRARRSIHAPSDSMGSLRALSLSKAPAPMATGGSCLRILFLTPGCFDKGGISRYSRYQVRALRDLVGESNVDVLSVLGPDEHSFEEPFDVRFAAGGIGRAQKLGFVAQAMRIALLEKPSLIYAAHVNLSGLARSLARLTGAQTALNVYGGELRTRLRQDSRWGLSGAHHVVADCHVTAGFVEEKGHRPHGSTSVVWDCVDLDRFHPGPVSRTVLERYGIPDPRTGKNLVTLGRMSARARHKGYDRLLDVFARVAQSVPDLRLVYAGGGDLIETLRAKAASLGLAHRVFFTGPIHESDMTTVYRSAHFFSLVSDCVVGGGEGIPLTPLEAAACGVPIFVGNQDGSQEAVVDGANGFVIAPFDLDDHAAKLSALANDESRRSAMGRAGTAAVKAHFSYEGFRDKHSELLGNWFPRARLARFDVAPPPTEAPVVIPPSRQSGSVRPPSLAPTRPLSRPAAPKSAG